MNIAKRDYRYSWHPVAPLDGQTDGNYELTAICLWSVVGVIMVTFLVWLALGGAL